MRSIARTTLAILAGALVGSVILFAVIGSLTNRRVNPPSEEAEDTAAVLPTPPTPEAIALRAYELWQVRLRNGMEGSADQDWFTAEQELFKSERS